MSNIKREIQKKTRNFKKRKRPMNIVNSYFIRQSALAETRTHHDSGQTLFVGIGDITSSKGEIEFFVATKTDSELSLELFCKNVIMDCIEEKGTPRNTDKIKIEKISREKFSSQKEAYRLTVDPYKNTSIIIASENLHRLLLQEEGKIRSCDDAEDQHKSPYSETVTGIRNDMDNLLGRGWSYMKAPSVNPFEDRENGIKSITTAWRLLEEAENSAGINGLAMESLQILGGFWSAMKKEGLCIEGDGSRWAEKIFCAVWVYERMVREGVKPNLKDKALYRNITASKDDIMWISAINVANMAILTAKASGIFMNEARWPVRAILPGPGVKAITKENTKAVIFGQMAAEYAVSTDKKSLDDVGSTVTRRAWGDIAEKFGIQETGHMIMKSEKEIHKIRDLISKSGEEESKTGEKIQK